MDVYSSICSLMTSTSVNYWGSVSEAALVDPVFCWPCQQTVPINSCQVTWKKNTTKQQGSFHNTFIFYFIAHQWPQGLMQTCCCAVITGSSLPPRCLRVCPGTRVPGCRGWCQRCVDWIPEILKPETSCRTCWKEHRSTRSSSFCFQNWGRISGSFRAQD